MVLMVLDHKSRQKSQQKKAYGLRDRPIHALVDLFGASYHVPAGSIIK